VPSAVVYRLNIVFISLTLLSGQMHAEHV